MTEFDGEFEVSIHGENLCLKVNCLLHIHECHEVVGIHRPFQSAIAGRCRADLAIRLVYPQMQSLDSTIKC